MRKKILLFLFLSVLIFTRFYNVENTARFTRDESYDIVKLHQYWIEKKVTLVGAIDYTGSIVYSSFFYYTIMPFAVIGNFEPQSTVYGVAFYGIITAIIILLITSKVNKKYLFWAAILSIVWFPLVQSSRWSWNPHVVPLWMSLGILSYFKKKNIFLFLSGVFFGLAFHIHYISFISTATFLALVTLINLWKRKYWQASLPILGFVLLIIPYAIFDLRHPPGLFFTGYLKRNLVSQGASNELTNFFTSFITNIQNSSFYLTQSQILSKLTLVLLTALVYLDFRKKAYSNFIYFLPAITQTMIISFLPSFGNRYFLPSLIFLFIYLILPRKNFGRIAAKGVILVFILGGFLSIKSVLTKPILEPGPRVIADATNHIKDIVSQNELKNINVAVLASPDPDPIGLTYRDILLTKDVEVLPASQYSLTDNLFVMTTSDEEDVRKDAANIMDRFRKGKLSSEYDINKSKWRVYLFERGI